MNKAIFLDRDGTLNYDFGYVYRKEDLKLLDGVVESLNLFVDSGYMLIVITNQSGIGRGYFTKEECDEFNDYFCDELMQYGIKIDGFLVCPHTPDDNCICRKPNPTMILDAANRYNINLFESFMIGDKESDVECGKNAHVTSYLIEEGKDLLYWAKEITIK